MATEGHGRRSFASAIPRDQEWGDESLSQISHLAGDLLPKFAQVLRMVSHDDIGIAMRLQLFAAFPSIPRRMDGRSLAAYHEAGHAVLGAAIHDPPVRVSIRNTDDKLGS